jgi:hypothetical protein
MESPAIRLGATAAVGLVTAIVVWLLFAWMARPGHELAEIRRLQSQFKPPTAGAMVPISELAAGLCTNDLDTAVADTRNQLQINSAANHITLLQLEVASAPAAGRLAVAELALKAKGPEANLMRFIASTAAERPSLAIDQFSLQRTASPSDLEADFHARLLCARL